MTDHILAEHIIEQINDALIYTDTNGNIQRWNNAACQLFGFSKTEALGQNLNIIIPERSRKAHWHGFEMAIQNKTLKLSGKPTLTRALHKDNDRKLYVELSFALIMDDSGDVIGTASIARDVSAKMEK